jgi:YHS domain-containing protein
MWKNVLGCVVLSIGIAAGVAIGGDAKDKGNEKGPATTQSAADLKMVNKYCAVMGEDKHEVDPEVFVIYEGKKVGFCCKDCIEPFEKNPKKYMKDLQ